MSDTYLVIVPDDPWFVPSADAQQALTTELRTMFPEAAEVLVTEGPVVLFRDAGGDLESVTCPACGADLTDDWADLMSEDFDGEGFALVARPLPCCAAEAPLSALLYDPSVAFSRFAVAVHNPAAPEPGPDAVATLARAMGCPVRVVARHV